MSKALARPAAHLEGGMRLLMVGGVAQGDRERAHPGWVAAPNARIGKNRLSPLTHGDIAVTRQLINGLFLGNCHNVARNSL